MKRKIFLAVALMLFFAGAVWAQLIPDPDVQGKINEASQRVTLKGRITHQQVGGYILKAGKAGEKIILNQNYEVLQKLAKERRQVTVQGKVNPFDLQARYIFIERIDGNAYHGNKAPMVKPPTKLTPLF